MFARHFFQEIPFIFCVAALETSPRAPALKVALSRNRVVLRSQEGEGFRKGTVGREKKRRKKGRAKSGQILENERCV